MRDKFREIRRNGGINGRRGGIVWTVSAKLGHVLEASLVSTISFDADEKGRQEEKGE
jgi:hypothetical protein